MSFFWVKYIDESGTIMSDFVPVNTMRDATAIVHEQKPNAHIYNVRRMAENLL